MKAISVGRVNWGLDWFHQEDFNGLKQVVEVLIGGENSRGYAPKEAKLEGLDQ